MSERCRHPGAASGILWDLKPGSSLAPPPLRENSPFPAASPGPRSEDLSHGKLEQLPRESWRIPAREKSRIAAGRTGGWILGRRSDSHHLALPRIPDLAWEPARRCLEFLGNSPFFFFPPRFSPFQPLPWKFGAFPAPGFTSRGLGLAKPVVFRDKLGFLGFADVLKGCGRSWLKEGLEFGSQQLRADIPMDRNS